MSRCPKTDIPDYPGTFALGPRLEDKRGEEVGSLGQNFREWEG